jgi:hypothetical protein
MDVHAPPIVFTAPMTREKYIVGVSPWEPYTPERLKELQDIYEKKKEEWHKNRKVVSAEEKARVFKVRSSSEDEKHEVVRYPSGRYECDCRGYTFRHRCSHIDKVKVFLKELP